MTENADSSTVSEGLTPGQRAHRRWHQVARPDWTPEEIAANWDALSNREVGAWEAVGLPPR